MGWMGTTELLILLTIVVLIFGASKVPQIGKQIGAGIRNFKDSLSGGEDDEKKKLEDKS